MKNFETYIVGVETQETFSLNIEDMLSKFIIPLVIINQKSSKYPDFKKNFEAEKSIYCFIIGIKYKKHFKD